MIAESRDAVVRPRRIGGLLILYLVGQGYLALHGLGLTVASVIINAKPGLAGVSQPKPRGSIAFYVATNVVLATGSIALIVLSIKKQRVAIPINAVWAVATIVCLVAWYLLGMKSPTGVVVDSTPGMVGLVYFALSGRVRETLISGLGFEPHSEGGTSNGDHSPDRAAARSVRI